MNLALKIKILEKFHSQADFASKVGVNDSLVSRVIRGRRELSVDQQRRWAAVLGVEDYAELFHDHAVLLNA